MLKRPEQGSLRTSDRARLRREGLTDEVIRLIDKHCLGVDFREVRENDHGTDESEELGTE